MANKPHHSRRRSRKTVACGTFGCSATIPPPDAKTSVGNVDSDVGGGVAGPAFLVGACIAISMLVPTGQQTLPRQCEDFLAATTCRRTPRNCEPGGQGSPRCLTLYLKVTCVSQSPAVESIEVVDAGGHQAVAAEDLDRPESVWAEFRSVYEPSVWCQGMWSNRFP